jgi:hypothetical protein
MLDAIAKKVEKLLPRHVGKNVQLVLGDPG